MTLHHLLQRYGYESLDEVRAEGETLALREAILEALVVRGLAIPDEVRQAIEDCSDPAVLRAGHRRALTADSAAAVVET